MRLALDHERVEALRGAVDGGRQAGGPGADHGHVEAVVLEPCDQAEGGGHRLRPGIDQDGSVEEGHHRPVLAGMAERGEHLAAFGRVGGEERVGDAVAGQEPRTAADGAPRIGPTTVTSCGPPPRVRDHSCTNSATVRWKSSSGERQGLST